MPNLDAFVLRVEKLEKDVTNIRRSLYGDGNGEIGLIRRVDKIEYIVNSIRKQNWFLIGMIAGIYIKVITDWLVK